MAVGGDFIAIFFSRITSRQEKRWEDNMGHGNGVLKQDITHLIQKTMRANEEVSAKIQQPVGLHEDPLTTVKRRKLKWWGQVSRSSV